MTTPDLEELRRLHEAAEPAPWKYASREIHPAAGGDLIADVRTPELSRHPDAVAKGRANGQLIVAARNALPWLLDEIARLKAAASVTQDVASRLTAENAALREGLWAVINEPPDLEDITVLAMVNAAADALNSADAARLTEPKETENG